MYSQIILEKNLTIIKIKIIHANMTNIITNPHFVLKLSIL